VKAKCLVDLPKGRRMGESEKKEERGRREKQEKRVFIFL
jgi:hypothetical protein